jgi:GAF domain-containing protein
MSTGISSHAESLLSLERITRTLADAAPLPERLGAIATEFQRITGAASLAIARRADTDGMLEFVAVAGADPSEILGLRVRVDESIASDALRFGQTLVRSDPPLMETIAATQALEGQRTTLHEQHVVIVPVRDGERITGAVLARYADDAAEPGEEERAALTACANLIALLTGAESSRLLVEDQRRELSALYYSARHVGGSLNIQEVLDSALTAISRYIDHQISVLFLMNDERTHLFVAGDRGLTDEEREVQLSADAPVTRSVLDAGRPRLIRDTAEECDFSPLPDPSRARSVLLAPIRSRDTALGLFLVSSGQPNAYTAKDAHLLQAIAAQTGVAIENAWLYDEAVRRAEEASALHELSQRIGSTLDSERIQEYAANSVRDLLKTDAFAILLLDDTAERLALGWSFGVDRERFAAACPSPGKGVAGWVFEWSTPTAVADLAADSRNRTAPLDQLGIVSAICVPIGTGECNLGVMLAMSARRRLFTVAEMELLYTIANQVAVALSNARLYATERSKSSAMQRYFKRIARALGSAVAEADVLPLLSDLILEVMRGDRAVIYSADGEDLVVRAHSGFRGTAQPETRIPARAGLAGFACRRSKPLAVTALAPGDARVREEPWLLREKMVSYLAVPLKVDRRVVGVMELACASPRVFSADEVKLFAQFGRRARLAERL